MQTQAASQTIDKPRKLLDGYLSETELAAELGYFPQTIRKWRARDEGPPHVLIGKKAYYPEDKFREWLRKRTKTPRGR
jgi:Helix-turn-helix domain